MKLARQVLFIPPTGEVKAIGDPPPELSEEARKIDVVRMSEVVPVNMLKRLAFRFIRRMVGHHGRVASWTRKWKGPWRALIVTGEFYEADNRSDCIDWEVNRLEQLLNGKG